MLEYTLEELLEVIGYFKIPIVNQEVDSYGWN